IHDAEVDRWVNAQPALVGPQGTVELNTISTIDVHLTGVVVPRHPEDDLTFRFADALDDLVFRELGMFGDDQPERVEDLLSRLVELERPWTVTDHVVVDRHEFPVHLELLYYEWI